MSTPAPASALGRRYLPHLADFQALLGRESSRYRLIAPLLSLVWLRLRRMLARLDRLAARWQRGALRPPRHRAAAARTLREIHPGEAWLPRRTPRGHAWLIRLHQPLAQLAPRIELMVHDPDIIALCAAAPQAARLLRPFCRMFGITPPGYLQPPPAPPRPRTPPPPPPPPFREHSPSQWPFVPAHLRLRVPGLPRQRKPG